jgi:hypothetical protein
MWAAAGGWGGMGTGVSEVQQQQRQQHDVHITLQMMFGRARRR